jgi:predicted RNase H-like HicB family nuclease
MEGLFLSPSWVYNEGEKGGGKMRFAVTLERGEDGWIVAECPSIPGCVSQGRTEEEALENIKEAIALCLEVRAEQGLPPIVRAREVEVA